jgi:hypothetical protein
LVGCFNGTVIDVIQDRTSKKTIELSEEELKDKNILVLDTIKCPTFTNKKECKHVVEEIRKRNRLATVEDMEEIDSNAEADDGISKVIKDYEDNGILNSVVAFDLVKLSMKKGPGYSVDDLDTATLNC